jgi:flagellar biosynthesis/type III secretory pathway chaperone
MPTLTNPVETIESTLVQEFRTIQALLHLTQDERLALAQADAPRLAALVERKGALLDQLAKLAEDRRRLGQDGATTKSEAEDARRLANLQSGILALSAQVRHLTLGNRALAVHALHATANFQTSLAWDSEAGLPALFAAIIAARDALDAQDSARISAAIRDMQDALEQLGDALGETPSRPLAERREPVAASQPAPRANLVEQVAHLYSQEAAYRAVLQMSNRLVPSAQGAQSS